MFYSCVVGRVVLGDLGISKVLEGTMDFAQTCIGTPYYMSPEIFKNKPYNHKSDVWALGCVLYEMVTLKHAFDANSINGLACKIIRGYYPPIHSSYSKELRDLIDEMLAVNPAQRPAMPTILRKSVIKKHVFNFLSDIIHRDSSNIGEGTLNVKNACLHLADRTPQQPARKMGGGLGIAISKDMETLSLQLKSLGLDKLVHKALQGPANPSNAARGGGRGVGRGRGRGGKGGNVNASGAAPGTRARAQGGRGAARRVGGPPASVKKVKRMAKDQEERLKREEDRKENVERALNKLRVEREERKEARAKEQARRIRGGKGPVRRREDRQRNAAEAADRAADRHHAAAERRSAAQEREKELQEAAYRMNQAGREPQQQQALAARPRRDRGEGREDTGVRGRRDVERLEEWEAKWEQQQQHLEREPAEAKGTEQEDGSDLRQSFEGNRSGRRRRPRLSEEGEDTPIDRHGYGSSQSSNVSTGGGSGSETAGADEPSAAAGGSGGGGGARPKRRLTGSARGGLGQMRSKIQEREALEQKLESELKNEMSTHAKKERQSEQEEDGQHKAEQKEKSNDSFNARQQAKAGEKAKAFGYRETNGIMDQARRMSGAVPQLPLDAQNAGPHRAKVVHSAKKPLKPTSQQMGIPREIHPEPSAIPVVPVMSGSRDSMFAEGGMRLSARERVMRRKEALKEEERQKELRMLAQGRASAEATRVAARSQQASQYRSSLNLPGVDVTRYGAMKELDKWGGDEHDDAEEDSREDVDRTYLDEDDEDQMEAQLEMLGALSGPRESPGELSGEGKEELESYTPPPSSDEEGDADDEGQGQAESGEKSKSDGTLGGYTQEWEANEYTINIGSAVHQEELDERAARDPPQDGALHVSQAMLDELSTEESEDEFLSGMGMASGSASHSGEGVEEDIDAKEAELLVELEGATMRCDGLREGIAQTQLVLTKMEFDFAVAPRPEGKGGAVDVLGEQKSGAKGSTGGTGDDEEFVLHRIGDGEAKEEAKKEAKEGHSREEYSQDKESVEFAGYEDGDYVEDDSDEDSYDFLEDDFDESNGDADNHGGAYTDLGASQAVPPMYAVDGPSDIAGAAAPAALLMNSPVRAKRGDSFINPIAAINDIESRYTMADPPSPHAGRLGDRIRILRERCVEELGDAVFAKA
jgi:hypothetical protein